LLTRCSFPPAGTPVTCAVSGGADSSALLLLAVAAGLEVEVVHVDHGLREGSDAEAQLVAALAGDLGVAFRAATAHVAPGSDLEARARAARHAVLPEGTLLGHTADDQAETVLIRLLRGTGPGGLAAMRSATHPLLGLRRFETEALCAEAGIVPLQDPSNKDPAFTRNRVRHEVLPLLSDVAGRDVVPLLCRLAGQQAEQADLLEHLAVAIDPADARAVAAAPAPLAAAALRRWWHEVTGRDHPPGAAALGRILAVAAGTDRACDVLGGWRVRRSEGRLHLEGPTQGGAAGDEE
jgi:tRNA(Ile)-lysidine synthase